MRKILRTFLILFILGITKVEAQKSEAADEILYKIINAGIALEEEKPLNNEDLKEIVCLTNISTKKCDGNYLGIFYYPTKSEIQLWKNWFEENKTKISYSTNSDIFNKVYYQGKRKLIQVEYESGKFRNTFCGEDQNFQDDWKKWNSKN